MTRRVLFTVVLLAVVVAAAWMSAARRTTGPPLDPASTAPDGTRALVELVDRLGGSMDVVDVVPGPGVDAAVLLDDRLGRDQATALEAWVRAGGTLVVADPGSVLTPNVLGSAVDEVQGSCAIPGLAAVSRLRVGVGRTYAVAAAATGCFGAAPGEGFVVATPRGAGRVVAVGGTDLFTNDLLDEADNAVLVAQLLAGEGSRAAFLRPALPGGGDRSLVDLVDTPVRAALAQLVVAFAVVVAWRARRLGRPVEEPQPVRIEGSELTRAVGRLLGNNRHPERAAAILRDRARRDLSGLLGLPLDAERGAVVHALAVRTDLTDAEIHRAVADPVRSDAELVDVATLLARIREEIIHDRAPQRSDSRRG